MFFVFVFLLDFAWNNRMVLFTKGLKKKKRNMNFPCCNSIPLYYSVKCKPDRPDFKIAKEIPETFLLLGSVGGSWTTSWWNHLLQWCYKQRMSRLKSWNPHHQNVGLRESITSLAQCIILPLSTWTNIIIRRSYATLPGLLAEILHPGWSYPPGCWSGFALPEPGGTPSLAQAWGRVWVERTSPPGTSNVRKE